MQLGENPIRLAVFASAKRLEAECLQILPAALLRSISAPHSFYPSAGMRSSCQSLRVQYSRFCEDIFALFQSTNGLCGQAAFPPIQTAAVFLFSLIIVLYGVLRDLVERHIPERLRKMDAVGIQIASVGGWLSGRR